MLAPREAAEAISYALRDRGPDQQLTKAAESGHLNCWEDYKREVLRMLAEKEYDQAPGVASAPAKTAVEPPKGKGTPEAVAPTRRGFSPNPYSPGSLPARPF